MQVRKQAPDVMEFDITGCRYADFFRALGEPELGAVLLCEADDHMAAVGGPEVEFTRTADDHEGCQVLRFPLPHEDDVALGMRRRARTRSRID